MSPRKSSPRSLWSDTEMLRALSLRDAGRTHAQISAALERSLESVSNTLKRIDRDYRQSEGA